MGANQSRSSENPAGVSNPSGARTCYYELLSVAQTASDEEIKKAYRKKALELHPDRNLDNIEHATKSFADVQAAYEILSDPQERAWYDSHRDVILHGDGDPSEIHEHNIRVTTTHDVLSFLRRCNGHFELSDSPSGFYGALRGFFATLAQEEESICQLEEARCLSYPSFGNANESYAEAVRKFYSVWASFATIKSFSWKDVYRLSDAPDRRIRRLMEKENKRIRDEAVREFNDAVRSLVAFAKKRDPRVPASKESDVDRQRILRDATAAQAIRSKLANQAKISPADAIPAWMQASEPTDDEFEEKVDSVPKEIIECIVCKKVFKSENQFVAHERSKKHSKAVHRIHQKMRQDAEFLNLDVNDVEEDALSPVQQSSLYNEQTPLPGDVRSGTDEHSQDLMEPLNVVDMHASLDSLSDTQESPETKFDRLEVQDRASLSQHTELADALGPSTCVIPSLLEGQGQSPKKLDPVKDGLNANNVQVLPKVGMAKAKRARKAAQQPDLATASASEHQCVTCQSIFPSKAKLFAHIKEYEHAQAPVSVSKARKKKSA